jgi:cytochrome P450
MVATVDDIADKPGVGGLPLVPRNPLPIRQQLNALRVFHTGQETLRDAGGPVTRLSLGPKWLLPPIVLATTPKGARDILGRSDALVERNKVHQEMRQLLGPNLFVITHDAWLPRRHALQPVFTKSTASAASAARCPGPQTRSSTAGPMAAKSTSTQSVAG